MNRIQIHGKSYYYDEHEVKEIHLWLHSGFDFGTQIMLINLFDDIVFDDIGAWSQICKDCLDKYPQLQDQKTSP